MRKENVVSKNEKENRTMENRKVESKMSVKNLLETMQASKYKTVSAIVGECHVYIKEYTVDCLVSHADKTFVYSIRKDNPAKEDVQPDDVVTGYVRLNVEIVQGNKTNTTNIIVYQQNFDRLATSIMNSLGIVRPKYTKPKTLVQLLNLAVEQNKPIPVTRVRNQQGYIMTLWAPFTHQPKYEDTAFVLNKEQNLTLFEQDVNTRVYYPVLAYNKPYTLTIDELYIKENGGAVEALCLRLVDGDYQYIIRTTIQAAVNYTCIGLSYAFTDIIYNDLQEFCDKVKGAEVTVTVSLGETSKGTQYEKFNFTRKEVK